MKKEKVFKFVFFVLLISYLALYFSSVSGYYEYQNYQKMTLTKEQFEEDVKQGKALDVEDYIIKENVHFNNQIANAGKKISYTLSDALSVVLSKFFNFLASFITE